MKLVGVTLFPRLLLALLICSQLALGSASLYIAGYISPPGEAQSFFVDLNDDDSTFDAALLIVEFENFHATPFQWASSDMLQFWQHSVLDLNATGPPRA